MCRICNNPNHDGGLRADRVEIRDNVILVTSIATELNTLVKAQGTTGNKLADQVVEGARLLEVGEVNAAKSLIMPALAGIKLMVENGRIGGAKTDAIMRNTMLIEMVCRS